MPAPVFVKLTAVENEFGTVAGDQLRRGVPVGGGATDPRRLAMGSSADSQRESYCGQNGNQSGVDETSHGAAPRAVRPWRTMSRRVQKAADRARCYGTCSGTRPDTESWDILRQTSSNARRVGKLATGLGVRPRHPLTDARPVPFLPPPPIAMERRPDQNAVSGTSTTLGNQDSQYCTEGCRMKPSARYGLIVPAGPLFAVRAP